MSVHAQILLLPSVLVLGMGCGSAGVLSGLGRSFDEIEAEAATRVRETENARLVQARERSAPGSITDAVELAPDAPVPPAWLADGRPLLVVARDPGVARRLAAHLVRSGAGRVSVVRGGIEPWLVSEPPRDATTASQPAPGGKT